MGGRFIISSRNASITSIPLDVSFETVMLSSIQPSSRITGFCPAVQPRKRVAMVTLKRPLAGQSLQSQGFRSPCHPLVRTLRRAPQAGSGRLPVSNLCISYPTFPLHLWPLPAYPFPLFPDSLRTCAPLMTIKFIRRRITSPQLLQKIPQTIWS